MSPLEVFKKFYPQLTISLPLDDVVFVAELYSHNLLPEYLKEEINAKPTHLEKASDFLDKAIEPSVYIGEDSAFIKLLNIMKDSEYPLLNELAEKIKRKLKKKHPANIVG